MSLKIIFCLKGFNVIYGEDFSGQRSLLILIRSDLQYIIEEPQALLRETLSIKLFAYSSSIRINLAYISPGSFDPDRVNAYFREIFREPEPNILIGDFNLPSIDWKTYTSNSKIHKIF